MSDGSGNKSNVKLIIAVVALVAAGIITYLQVGAPDAADIAADRAYMDIENGEVFNYTIKSGDMEPIETPAGRRTGYRAEACYWGKDSEGRWYIKDKPTYVVLKQRLDPTSEEPTYCPDCGRRVVGHNKKPTQEQIDAANAGQGSSDEESVERGD